MYAVFKRCELGLGLLLSVFQTSCTLVGYEPGEDSPVQARADAGDSASHPGALPEARSGAALGDASAADAQSPSGSTLDLLSGVLLPPIVTDALSASTGHGADASVDAFTEDAGTSLAACGGARAVGLCWYLGSLGSSCDQVCSPHGGFDPRATSQVGTTAQGGSEAACHHILRALDVSAVPFVGVRYDSYGMGCHVWFTGVAYWLDDPSPAFRPTVSGPATHIACGCMS